MKTIHKLKVKREGKMKCTSQEDGGSAMADFDNFHIQTRDILVFDPLD